MSRNNMTLNYVEEIVEDPVSSVGKLRTISLIKGRALMMNNRCNVVAITRKARSFLEKIPSHDRQFES